MGTRGNKGRGGGGKAIQFMQKKGNKAGEYKHEPGGGEPLHSFTFGRNTAKEEQSEA